MKDQSAYLEFFEKKVMYLNIKDPRLKEIIHVVEANQCFDEKCIKILIAILMDIDPEGYGDLIGCLANLHEEDTREDERPLFVTLLLCEITARRKVILEELKTLEIKKPVISILLPNEKECAIEEVDDELIALDPCATRKARKSKTRSKSSYLITKNGKKKDVRKTRLTFKDKIIASLNEKKSFLIHQHSFPLPTGIKRIRIQKEFSEVVSFIENYIKEKNLPVKVVVEDDRAKILFNGKESKRPKSLYMRKTRK